MLRCSQQNNDAIILNFDLMVLFPLLLLSLYKTKQMMYEQGLSWVVCFHDVLMFKLKIQLFFFFFVKAKWRYLVCVVTFQVVRWSKNSSSLQLHVWKHSHREPWVVSYRLAHLSSFMTSLSCFALCCVCILLWPLTCVDSVLCCFSVVFDSGRCNLPHGHQFGTAPSRGRQRAELIPLKYCYIDFSSFCFLSSASDCQFINF